jgi:choice-of-anchor B domain-containing protein
MRPLIPRSALGLVVLLYLLATATWAQPGSRAGWLAVHEGQDHGGKEDSLPIPYSMAEPADCERGKADIFQCKRVDLLGHVGLPAVGAPQSANDVWGWFDARTGREYGLMGHSLGTTFVDVTDPRAPIVVGTLPTETVETAWRDIKVYGNWAYIVADGAPQHGVQVFNLKRLRRAAPPEVFAPNRVYDGVGSSHNIAINEETGYAYAVGSDTCEGGLHMIDLRRPARPTFAGCFSEDGYTHDAQCVVYGGPDATHVGREICFNANGDTLTIVDVESKVAPLELSRTGYDGARYVHQGWLTRNHRYFLLDDELDEIFDDHATYTYVFDVQDLDSPTLVGHFTSTSTAIDHNLYVRGAYVFQANYRSGLRILRIDDLAEAQMTQVAFFDTYPADDLPEFDGAWSVYPYFESGNVVVTSQREGLFVVRYRPRSIS